MKAQDLGRRLEVLSVLLGHAQPEMLERLAAVSDILKATSAANLGQFTKALGASTPPVLAEPGYVTGGDLAAALSTLLDIARQLEAKKAITDDFAALRDAFSATHLQPAGVIAIVAGLKARKKPAAPARAKKTESVREEIVAEYLRDLQATLGLASFEQHYERLTKDRRVRAIEVAAITSQFVSETPKNAKKSESLQRIRARHDNLMDSRLKDKVLTLSNQGR
jgi:hypothetical protein